ncbi:mucin-5AC-like [Drosophila obscura]|uniref:mucin-5AC-like n=1 Tax=Drosophila obscura TaxID=7282 RepID=UPI001BB1B54D|nr:mucin-5AC-like [Drosophila obscura]
MQKIIAVLAFAAYGPLVFVAAQKCQECQSGNSAYCYSQTAYRNCMQNNPIGDIVSCGSGYVCSNTEEVCVMSHFVDGSSVLDVCGAAGANNGENCEVCSGSNKYSCVSETQFVRCVDQQVSTANVYSCDTDEICVIEALATHGTLCVPTIVATFLNESATCSNSEYVAPPNPTVPTMQEQVKACKEAGELPPNSNNLSFFTGYTNDATCNSYLYCEKVSSVTWIAILYNCDGAEPFFDSASSRCVSIRPADCAATTTSRPQEQKTSSTALSTEASSTAGSTTSIPQEPTESSTSSNSEASSEDPSTTGSTTSTPQEPTESSTSSISEASSEDSSTPGSTSSSPQEPTESSTTSSSEASSETPATTAPATDGPQEPTESSTTSNYEASSEDPSTAGSTTSDLQDPPE